MVEAVWGFIGAIIGSIIGGTFTLKGVSISHKNDLKKQKTEESTLLKGFLLSIRGEIKTLWDRYMWGVGKDLEKLLVGKPFLVTYPLTQNYFIVYDSNASLIGKIEDDDLRELIVIAYTCAKGLIDSYKLNNDLVQKWGNLVLQYQLTNNPVFDQNAKALLVGLTDYVVGIKELHFEMKDNVAKLLEKLDKSISK